MQCLVNTVDESELPSQAITVFAWSSKKCGCTLSWWKVIHFLLTNSRWFSLSAAFIWPTWEQFLLELTIWFSRSSFIIEDWLSSNSTIYTTSPSLDEDWPLVWLLLVHFACSMISSVPHYCIAYIFFIAHHDLFKNGTFLLHLSRELHLEIWSRRFFFPLMWNPNIKAINIPKLVQMILSAWFGYFEYVSHLLHGIM